MSSDSDRLMNETKPAPTYVYPLPLIPADATSNSAAGRTATTLERLWVPDPTLIPAPGVTEEENRAREDRARKAGREEGLAQGVVEFEKKLAAERQSLASTVREFARERTTYFQHIEREVVALAVAIARKILHREAQVDPLLLAGVVRVGLDKIASGTRVKLRVHPNQIQIWKAFFSKLNDLQSVPELVADGSLGPGNCILETELGATDLTLEAQLKEIEQGFFDLLAHRPGKTHD